MLYELYTDETGDFQTEVQKPWMIGGLWGPAHEFEQLKKFGYELIEYLNLSAETSSISKWGKTNSGKYNHDKILDALSQTITALKKTSISFVYMQHNEDMRRSDKKSKYRYTNMLLALVTNLVGRNPASDFSDFRIRAGSRTRVTKYTWVNLFDTEIFNLSWDASNDYKIIRPISIRKDALSALSDRNSQFRSILILSDLIWCTADRKRMQIITQKNMITCFNNYP